MFKKKINLIIQINLHQNTDELQELKSTLALYQKFKGISTRSTEERAEVKKAFKAVDKRQIIKISCKLNIFLLNSSLLRH